GSRCSPVRPPRLICASLGSPRSRARLPDQSIQSLARISQVEGGRSTLCKAEPMTSPARNRQGDATRLRLIKTAERLFAAHGVDAVSVRAINAAAGLGAASVHYHFGSKDELLAAVLVELGAPVRDRIRANAELLADAPQPPDAESLVRAVTTPYLELLQRHRTRG